MAREILSVKGLESAYKKAVEEAKTKATRIKVADGNSLYLIVRANGGASWILNYRMRAGDAAKPLTLCEYGRSGNLKLARELAEEARIKIIRGVDPKAEKDQNREVERLQAVSAGHTVKVLFEEWLTKKSTGEEYLRSIRAAFVKDVLVEIGHRKPEDIKREDIMKILRAIEDRDSVVVLRRVRMWLRQMFEYGIDHEAYAIDALPVPTGNLTSFRTRKPGHFMAITDPKLIPKLLTDIDSYSRPVTRFYLQIAANLFVRPSELRESSWGQFNLVDKVWVIPAEVMKLRREFWVPLSDQVVELLQKLRCVLKESGPGDALFPGISGNRHMSEATANEALRRLGYKGIHTPHGFRSMARTILEERLHKNPDHLEKQLSHEEQNKVKRAYNRSEFWAQRIEIMQTWSDWLDIQRLSFQPTPPLQTQSTALTT